MLVITSVEQRTTPTKVVICTVGGYKEVSTVVSSVLYEFPKAGFFGQREWDRDRHTDKIPITL